MVDFVDANGSNITGKVFLQQLTPDSAVMIEGEIYNLKEGLHGFHVHENGETGNDCADAGGHFNPTNVRLTALYCFLVILICYKSTFQTTTIILDHTYPYAS